MTTRRELFLLLGALAASSGSYAQQPNKIWRVGYLAMRSRPASLATSFFGVFMRSMRELGYVEGKNLVVEWRSAEGNEANLPHLATELANLNVDIVISNSTPTTRALQKASTTIPIVMVSIGDPVRSGFIKSLAQPGGNITGLTSINVEISPKHLEMLHSMVPKLSRVAVLVNPSNPANLLVLESIQSAARRTGAKILPVEVRTPSEIGNAFALMSKEKTQAFIIATGPPFSPRRIAELALKHRLPSVYERREYAEAGGLMSYGASLADQYRRAATYVDKIFKGANPGDLPVEQPTKFELVINGKTAKALGLTIPQSLLISATKVIE